MDRRGSGAVPGELDRRELADAWRGLAAYRDQVDEVQASRAAAMATDLVAGLVADQRDLIVEDALCGRLGVLLGEAVLAPIDERVGPRHLAEALVTAAEAAVEAATGDVADAWRVLVAVADILPYPNGEAAVDAIARVRDSTGGRMLPAALPGPVVTGSVLWTRDRYGSRFAVAAPITTTGQPVRWYLWDIDVCGHQALTVHSGFYATPEAALAGWQAGVGQPAAAGAVFAEVDDPWLLAELLFVEDGLSRVGGENVEQFAEYYRGRRLGEVVKQAVERRGTRQAGGLTVAAATVEFAAWLRARDAGHPELPAAVDELAAELAESWNNNEIDAVYGTCSPHRVALCVLHLRNFYLEEFADQLVALLPEWTRWLAERNGTPPELADRCLPYANGQPHTRVGQDDVGPDYLARVLE